MLSDRLQRVESQTLIFKVLAAISIGAVLLSIILFFAAYTGQFIPDADVKAVWRSFRIALLAAGACMLLAFGFYISSRRARASLERYYETQCSECGFDLRSLIVEKKKKRESERKRGTAIHASLYFDIYCPNCNCQRTTRE